MNLFPNSPSPSAQRVGGVPAKRVADWGVRAYTGSNFGRVISSVTSS